MNMKQFIFAAALFSCGCREDPDLCLRDCSFAKGYDIRVTGTIGYHHIKIGTLNDNYRDDFNIDKGLIYAVDMDGDAIIDQITLTNVKPGSKLEELASVKKLNKIAKKLPSYF